MTHAWFQERSDVQRLFSPVDDLVSSKEDWALTVADVPETRPGLADPARRNAMVIYKCTKDDLQSQIDVLREPHGHELTTRAEEAMKMAGLAKYKWMFDRQSTPGRKASTNFQTSMTAFSQFLQNFSGIVSIAQAADQQYGGLAYGTLSLMLSVFVHKTAREDALHEGFEEIGLTLPRLQTLQRLRQGFASADVSDFQPLEALITKTFFSILTFAREATEYYASKARRFKDSLKPTESKDKTLTEIRKHLSEIRNECDILMLSRITSLQGEIHNMSINVQRTQLSVQATHDKVVDNDRRLIRANDSSDFNHLAHLRQILGVAPEGSRHTGAEACVKYKNLLYRELFSGPFLRSRRVHPSKMSMELLRADDEFSKWWESPHSYLLLAGGTNSVQNYASGSLNWLSYGAVLAIEERRQRGQKIAFFLAQTALTVTKRLRRPFREVMASLLYQMAEMHDTLLRSKTDTLQALVRSDAWQSNDSDSLMLALQPVLLGMLAEFPSDEEIVLVIDRFDQCAWEEDDDGQTHVSMRRAVEGLLRIAAEAPCRVRILLIVDAAFSKHVVKARAVFSKKESKALLLKPEWYQVMEEGRSSE